MKRYRVKKETYENKLIEDLGTMTIDELYEYGKQFIGDVFADEEDLKEDMRCIEETGDELWLCNYRIQIEIYEED